MRVIFIALSAVIISITSATAISFTIMCGNNIILFPPPFFAIYSSQNQGKPKFIFR